MSGRWYDPDEIRRQAAGYQRQPEFPSDRERDATTKEATEALAAIARHQEMTNSFRENLVN